MNQDRRKDPQRRVLAEGHFARLVAQHGWEWVERVNSTGAVVIVALTAQRELVLVEQYRIPLQRRVLDLPAGLAGDEPGTHGEDLAAAARRELLEETGFVAPRLEFLNEGPSSAGLASETYALFLARDAQRVAAGGGDDKEDIQVHVVPLAEITTWLDARRQSGVMIDPKIFAALYFAQNR